MINSKLKYSLLLASLVLAGCGSDGSKAQANNAPLITSTEITTASIDTSYRYTLAATDADNDVVILSAISLPSWLTFDAATGLLTGTPLKGDVGEHTITLMASDGNDDTTQSFTLAVVDGSDVPVNNAPVITSTAGLTASIDTTYSYTFVVTDADNDVVTISATGLSLWLTFDVVTGILSGTPTESDVGDHTVTLVASDGIDDTSQFLTITVSMLEPDPDLTFNSEKRGIAYGENSEADLAITQGKIKWWYNWGLGAESTVVDVYTDYGYDFVPMTWNASFNETELRSYLDAHPDVEYLLGFNEPNFSSQANLTPEQAAAHWPKLEVIAQDYELKLVAPAVNYAPGDVDIPGTDDDWDPWKYLDAFFAACEECQVDYIAVHSYMKYASAFQWYVGEFERYNKPIWVTEWADWDDGGPANMGEQMDYMAETVRWLENNDMVYRYSWFLGRSSEGFDKFPYLDILAADGALTPLGSVYTSIPAVDYRYSTPAYIQAEGAHRLNGFTHEPACDFTGLAQLESKTGDFVEYDLNLAAAGEFAMQFRLASQTNSTLVVKLDGVEVYTLTDFSTAAADVWHTFTSDLIDFSEGEHTLRIEATGSFGFNWLTIGDAPVDSAEDPVCGISIEDPVDEVNWPEQLVIFEDSEEGFTPAQYNDGGSVSWSYPTDDAEHGTVLEFVSNSANQVSYLAADAGSINLSDFAGGTITFDLKVVQQPFDDSADWLMKVECVWPCQSIEPSFGAQADFPVGTWQSVTINIDDLTNLNLANVDNILAVFPTWGGSDGAIYRIDNVYWNKP